MIKQPGRKHVVLAVSVLFLTSAAYLVVRGSELEVSPEEGRPIFAELSTNDPIEVNFNEGGKERGLVAQDSQPKKGSALSIDDSSLDDINSAMAGLPTEEEANLGAELMREYGRFSGESEEVYLGYDQSTLEALASDGDLQALQILADRAFDNKFNDPVKAYETAYEAVVHGSTVTIANLAIMKKDRRMREPATSPEYKQAQIESIAWLEYGILRGDPMVKGLLNDFFLQLDEFENADEEVFAKARALAQDIYTEVEQERIRRGLSAFDDEDTVKKMEDFYSLMSGDYIRDLRPKIDPDSFSVELIEDAQ